MMPLCRGQQWSSQLQKLSQGFRLIFHSRYLLVMCSYLMMTYVSGGAVFAVAYADIVVVTALLSA